jgi:uncharacterized membrane protein
MILIIHTLAGIVALIAGAINLLRTKGTPRHRQMGWLYAAAMYLLIGTSFFIYEVFGRFGAFHILAIVSGFTLTLGLYFPLRRRHDPGWLEHHYFWMGFAYIGLVMATGSHFFAYVPQWPFWVGALAFWGLPFLIGTLLIYRQRKRLLGRYAGHLS